MTTDTQPQESFYDRLRRQKRELLDLIQADQKETAVLDTGPRGEELDKKLKAAFKKSRKLWDDMHALDEQEENPPWKDLSTALLYADYAKVDALTADGTIIALMNKERVPALGQPSYAGDEKIVDLLIARGADVNIPGNDNLTPLAYATMKDNAKIFAKLLKAGANPGTKTKQGDSLRDLAGYNDAEGVLKILNSKKRMAELTGKPAPAVKPKR